MADGAMSTPATHLRDPTTPHTTTLKHNQDLSAIVLNVGTYGLQVSYEIRFMRVFDEIGELYQSQLISTELRRGIVDACFLEVDHASRCLSTSKDTTMLFLELPDLRWYASLENVRSTLCKDPVLHDRVKCSVHWRKVELQKLQDQNNMTCMKSCWKWKKSTMQPMGHLLKRDEGTTRPLFYLQELK